MAKLRPNTEPVRPGATVDGRAVPPELLDAEAPVWHDREAYAAFMAERGWSIPPGDRLGGSANPGNRRLRAASSWARSVGITKESRPAVADLKRLRDLGLIGATAPPAAVQGVT